MPFPDLESYCGIIIPCIFHSDEYYKADFWQRKQARNTERRKQ